MKSNGLILVVAGVLLLCLCFSGVSAAGICPLPGVCNTNTHQNFATIQAAIDDITTMAGDTITVDGPSGSSYAPFTVSKQQLTIQGRDNGNGLPRIWVNSGNAIYINPAANGVTIDGFTLNAVSGPMGTGVWIDSSDNLLNNIHVYDFQDGILINGKSNNQIRGCGGSGNAVGVSLSPLSQLNTLDTCTFDGNPASSIGVQIAGANQNSIVNSEISNMDKGIDLYTTNSGGWVSESNTILNNYLHTNNNAIFLDGYNNNIKTNTITLNSVGIAIGSQGYGNTITNNNFKNSNNVNIGLGGNVWNTGQMAGPNIMLGPYLGGNYWANPSGTGFSETSATCTDGNSDGFCDAAYTLGTGNIDNLPLTATGAPNAPEAIFSATPQTGLAPLSVTFTDDSTGIIDTRFFYYKLITTTSWTQFTPDTGTHAFTFTDPGTYDIQLTVNGPGGSNTLTRTSYITVSTPVPGSIDVSSTPSGAEIWIDGPDTHEVTPHTFDNIQPGNHVVQVALEDYWSQSDSEVNVISGETVSTPFMLVSAGDFTATQTSVPLTVQFTEALTDTLSSRYWSFGDGTSSTDENPSHLYTTPGVFTVSLDAYTNDAHWARITKDISVLAVDQPAISREQAIDYGVTNYLGGITQGNGKQELLVSDIPVPAGTVVTLLDGSTITSPPDHPTWLVFINEDKNANWGHASKYAFIYDSNVIQATPIMFPPTGIALSHAAGKVPNPAGLTSIVPPFNPDPACAPDASHNYALLISGGGTKETNYARYYNDIKFMYNTLVTDYKYPKNHIKVLMSDGTDDTADQLGSYNADNSPNYINSEQNLDTIAGDDVNGAAAYQNVIDALNSYGPSGTSPLSVSDNLLIFTTGHGASNTNYGDPNTNQVDLLLWGTGVKITDTDFVAHLPAAPKISMMMEQCNGGGFKDNFIKTGTPTRVLATAATGAQSSHSNDFSYYWITGQAGHDSVANPANADLNPVDGQVSMKEGYDYAYKFDPSGPNFANIETPTFFEYGTGTGKTQFLSACAANPPSITVTAPTAGVTWTKGTQYTATWSSSNLPASPAPYVKVELRKGTTGEGKWQATLSSSVLASAKTTAAWTVPATLPGGAGSDYWIKISTIGSISPKVVGKSPTFTVSGVTASTTGTLKVNALPSAIATGSRVDILDSAGNPATIGTTEQTGKTTPYTGTGLASDTYRVTVSKSCYYSSSSSVTLLPGATQTKTLTLLAMPAGCENGVIAPYGSIAVTSVPDEGYEVFLDGKDMGYGTPVIQDINAGSHTVRLEASGFQPQSKSVTVTGGGQARADFTLIPQIPQVTANVLIVPQPLNIGRTGYFLAIVKLPTGNKAADVIEGSVSCEGAPALKLIRIKLFPQVFAAIFKRQDLHTVQPGTKVPMSVVGTIKKSGGNVLFKGTANVNVISKKVTTKEDVDNVMTMPDTQVFTKFNKF